MDPAFPLLKIDGVAGEVPVHDRVTKRMEVETLLAR
jgi:hypothetical protein